MEEIEHEPAEAQEVELRFIAVEDGTRVELEHRDWDRLGTRAEHSRKNDNEGWVHVFDQCFLEACS